RLVVDNETLGRVARLVKRFGYHHGDAIADAAHLVAHEDRTPGAQALGAADIFGHEIGRQTAEAIGLNVFARQHTNDARGAARSLGVDALDPRMRMRREHDHRVSLVRQLDIVDKAAMAGEKAPVLDPAHRLADAVGLPIKMLVHERSLTALALRSVRRARHEY